MARSQSFVKITMCIFLCYLIFLLPIECQPVILSCELWLFLRRAQFTNVYVLLLSKVIPSFKFLSFWCGVQFSGLDICLTSAVWRKYKSILVALGGGSKVKNSL